MAFFRFTDDTATKRLRWVMIGTILFDKLTTLLGQPGSYWQHPETANEINRSWHYSLSRGLPFYILDSVAITSLLFLIVSTVPRKIALIVIFTVVLNHFFGASFWLSYHCHFGAAGPLIYGIILSVILVVLAFPKPSKTSTDKILSREPDA